MENFAIREYEDFEIIRTLGKGALGKVYLVKNEGKLMVLKRYKEVLLKNTI